MAFETLSEKPIYIYFIQCGAAGAIKIGTSEDPVSRYWQLQNASPEQLNLLLVLVGSVERELDLHALWAEHRVRGEWFNPHPEILDFVRSRAGIAVQLKKKLRRDRSGEHAFKCPHCGCDAARSGSPVVIDSRPCPRGIRRRRKCPHCKQRFTTIEAVVMSKHQGGSINGNGFGIIPVDRHKMLG